MVSLAINHYPARDRRPATAVIFGVTAPEVASVALALASGTLPLDVREHAFVAVAREEALVGASLAATMADGTVKSYPLGPAAT